MRKNLPPIELFLGKTIERFPNHVIQEHIGSGNNGHLFRAFDQSTASKLAFKVVPLDNLPEDENNLNEAKKANLLEHASVIECIDVVPYRCSDVSIKCVVFVCKYVEGKNLRDYMQQCRTDVNLSFVETFLRTMLELLYELKQLGYSHGDLHAGNVLVAKPKFDIYERTTFRVTDFGVRELTGHVTHADDYQHVADILRQLLECVEYRDCEGQYRYVYNILRNEFVGRHLIETDTIADPLARNPRALMDKLNSLGDQYVVEKKNPHSRLVTPFDYPNCEQIGNSHLLLKNLYSDRLLGLSDIQARSNLVLTGPRGCGKTTVFRALSLEYLVSTNGDNPNDVKYIGIYYRCHDDLYFSFPRYKCPERAEALDVPMHFLTVTLLAIALEQIGTWSKKHFSDELKKKEKTLVSELWELFEWSPPDNPSAGQLANLVNRLKGKERKRAVNKQRFVHVPTEPIEGYFGPRIMLEACRLIRSKFSFLRDRPFYFLIDDYSHPKITNELQANLNRLLMCRSPDVFFKLSTESPVSFARNDVDGKQFVETREYDLLNLGLRYITSDSEQTLEFLADLFNRRFQEVQNYPVQTLKQLLGSKQRNENAMARAFRQREEDNKRENEDNYAGCETIAAMCSGDIHYIIRLVARMIEEYGGDDRLRNSNAMPRIPWRQQHKSVRAAAGSFMDSIRTLPGNGQHLTEVVTAFGNVAHSYLRYETSTNEANTTPHQASRIEPYESLHISDEAQEILNELLRYSVLIEDPRGKSMRGKVVPRFYLRRYLIPHFRLTFSRRDSLRLENNQIEILLRNPQEFEASMKLDSWPRRDPNQERLFPDE